MNDGAMVSRPWPLTEGLKRGHWTAEEDQKLTAYIQQHGHGSWSSLPEKAAIALHLPKRTDNEIKNHWNAHLKKRLIKMGIDPMTHKPRIDALGTVGDGCHEANLNHMAQWERARLEAEARAALPNRVRIQPDICSGTDPLPLTPRPMCIDVLKAWQGMVNGMFNSSNAPVQVPIGETVVDSNATNHSYACNELVCMDEWKRFNQTQELENLIDESSTIALSQYATENAWMFADNIAAAADFNEGSSESDTLISVPVSFSSS
ncbi:hypothetical protein V6N13_105284 [Hibiscus sabdariffa]|uniref:Uncharacterized protein n=1 Tax=Hibiscus sabdariffa TaxID=183260 RepID=A0ABR2EY23_9ROSI